MNKLQVERLAHWLWRERGMPIGSPDHDWYLAEEILRRRNSRFVLLLEEMPLFSFGIERRTR